MGSELVLILVIVAAVAFDFTNGFHDTANAMATSIATGALKPRVAVMISAVLNFTGAFISISVAATIAKGIVDPKVLAGNAGLELVLAALLGAMTWNLITWYFTIPSSSSHALDRGDWRDRGCLRRDFAVSAVRSSARRGHKLIRGR